MIKVPRGREQFKKYKFLINILVKIITVFPKCMRVKMFEIFRMTKGKKGIVIRYIFLKSLAKKCGDNVSIHPNVYIFSAEKLILGDNISIHPMCYIDGSGGMQIESNVSIAHGVSILSSSHNYQNIDVPIKDQGIVLKPTIIKENVWIGAKATILFGVVINTGCIVGANSVVTKDLKENTISGGIPAKLLKTRVLEL